MLPEEARPATTHTFKRAPHACTACGVIHLPGDYCDPDWANTGA